MQDKKSIDFTSADKHNKIISVNCIVSGKNISPYSVPKIVKIICYPKSGKSSCSSCPLNDSKIVNISTCDENILKFIDVPDNRFESIIKEIFYINSSCKLNLHIEERQNLERIFILPTITRQREKDKLAQISYYAGTDLRINTSYCLTGYTTTDPKTQQVTHIFTDAVTIKSDVESFTLTEDKHKILTNGFGIHNKTVDYINRYLKKLYNCYAYNVTKIYDREDLHYAVDMVFRSPLSFYFDNELIHKGWLDVLIIGDTRCGKGYVAEKLSNYFGLGEVISGDNSSLPGLIGGVQQIGGHWVISWGKLPLNDGGLVIIDEASELTDEVWSRLSRIRSEGVAEISKIQSQVTTSRTRILFLANPVHKKISDFNHGIEAILGVVKSPEDIARFDYALVVAHNEVPVEQINMHREEIKPMHDIESERDLILWVWSRRPEEVLFSKEAINSIYEISNTISKKYSVNIPLIQGENVRIKLAKLSVCFASRVYSNKENGKYLYVDYEHVRCAKSFFNMIYDKEICGYKSFSTKAISYEKDYDEKDFIRTNSYFNSYGKNKKSILECLDREDPLDSKMLFGKTCLDMAIIREMLVKLSDEKCIESIGKKTKAFKQWLKLQLNERSK